MAAASGRVRVPPAESGRGAGRLVLETVDDAEGLYVAVERCPLCNSTRRRLTCAKCVQSGDFVFFDARNTERPNSSKKMIVLLLLRHYWRETLWD